MNRLRPSRLPLVLWIGLPAVLAGDPPSNAPDYPDHSRLLVVRTLAGEQTPVTTADAWQARRRHILSHVEEVMGPLPGPERRVPLDVRVVETFDEPDLVRKKVTFAVEANDRLPAWLLIPKTLNGKAPAALCLHQTVAIGKDEPVGLGGKPNLRYARELTRRGYVTLSPDYPNFGEYHLDVYARGYASASMKAVWNNMRAVDFLTTLSEVNPDKIAAVGHSLGGHNAIFTAVFDTRIKAVVSSCGFTSFPKYYGGDIKGWSHKGYMPRLKDVYGLDLKRVPFDFPELIAALAPRAFLAVSPEHDANFEVSGVRDCVREAAKVYALLGAPGMLRESHPDAGHDFPPEERQKAYRFLDEVLGVDR